MMTTLSLLCSRVAARFVKRLATVLTFPAGVLCFVSLAGERPFSSTEVHMDYLTGSGFAE